VKLKGVRSVVAEADTTFRMEQGPFTSKTKTYVAYPNKFRVDATIGGAEIVQVYNDGQAWMKDPRGVHDVPAGMAEEFSASVRRDMIPMLIGAAEAQLTLKSLGEDAREGQVLRILEISGEVLQPVKLYIDPKGLIARQVFTTTGPDGKPLEAEEVFSNYRNIEGIQVPFKAEVRRNGRSILERTLTGVKFNTDVPPSLFNRPS
jgi:outer membrane lipoprotein-sorting protein